MHCCRIVNGIKKNKNIKNSLGATWNASHLAVRLCALRHWKRVSMPPTTQSLRHPLTRAIHFAPRIKNRSPFHGEKPLKIVIYRLKAIVNTKRHSVGTCLWHVSMQTAMYQRIGNMPKACPYVIMRPPIVADINHRICEGKRNWGIFLFALLDNLISEDWFFAEGERFLSFWRCHRPR